MDTKTMYFNLLCGRKGDVRRITVSTIPELGLIGVAVCNPSDRFVKKIGRELSIKKLTSAPIKLPMPIPRNVSYTILEGFIELYLNMVYPTIMD